MNEVITTFTDKITIANKKILVMIHTLVGMLPTKGDTVVGSISSLDPTSTCTSVEATTVAPSFTKTLAL